MKNYDDPKSIYLILFGKRNTIENSVGFVDKKPIPTKSIATIHLSLNLVLVLILNLALSEQELEFNIS